MKLLRRKFLHLVAGAAALPYAKANPGKINMATGGSGAGSHMAGALCRLLARSVSSQRCINSVAIRGEADTLTPEITCSVLDFIP
jgi:tripartite-type tricarboxylate transporter receptor subunit TctC